MSTHDCPHMCVHCRRRNGEDFVEGDAQAYLEFREAKEYAKRKKATVSCDVDDEVRPSMSTHLCTSMHVHHSFIPTSQE